MSGLLLDTHIVLWLDNGHHRLRSSTRDLIDAHRRHGETIYFSAVSAWEIAWLADTKRIDIDVPVDVWVGRFLNRPGIEGAPLTMHAAARSYRLPQLVHRDPADRLLVMTAIELRCPMVTYDARLTEFAKGDGRREGFAVVA